MRDPDKYWRDSFGLPCLESRIQVGAELGVWHERATSGKDDDDDDDDDGNEYVSHEIDGHYVMKIYMALSSGDGLA